MICMLGVREILQQGVNESGQEMSWLSKLLQQQYTGVHRFRRCGEHHLAHPGIVVLDGAEMD